MLILSEVQKEQFEILLNVSGKSFKDNLSILRVVCNASKLGHAVFGWALPLAMAEHIEGCVVMASRGLCNSSDGSGCRFRSSDG